jgi:hypothetical protein
MLGISARMIFKCDLYATLTELRAIIRLCNVADGSDWDLERATKSRRMTAPA